MALNPRQQRFAEEYIKCGVAGQAARTAGYSNKTAESQGNRLLKDAKVKAYIRERMREINREIQADADEVMAFLAKAMRGEILDQFGLEPSLSDRISAAKELNKRYAAAEMLNKNAAKTSVEFYEEEAWTK